MAPWTVAAIACLIYSKTVTIQFKTFSFLTITKHFFVLYVRFRHLFRLAQFGLFLLTYESDFACEFVDNGFNLLATLFFLLFFLFRFLGIFGCHLVLFWYFRISFPFFLETVFWAWAFSRRSSPIYFARNSSEIIMHIVLNACHIQFIKFIVKRRFYHSHVIAKKIESLGGCCLMIG